jgi:hypothetical protein
MDAQIVHGVIKRKCPRNYWGLIVKRWIHTLERNKKITLNWVKREAIGLPMSWQNELYLSPMELGLLIFSSSLFTISKRDLLFEPPITP